jgi:hypothetical protein
LSILAVKRGYNNKATYTYKYIAFYMANTHNSIMKKAHLKKQKIKYPDESIGKVKVSPDFLPSPANLVSKEENVKVTISLTRESLDFFKEEAKIHNTQYQKMIRRLLDDYAHHYRA